MTFHAPSDVRRDAYLRLTELTAQGRLSVAVEVTPLDEIGAAWDRQRKGANAKQVISCG